MSHLARAAESLEIVAQEPVLFEGKEIVDADRPLERHELERLASMVRLGQVSPKCHVRESLRGPQIVERIRAMLARQSDVRQLHEKGGFAPYWEELERRIDVPDTVGSLLAVIATARPGLFTQALLGGYVAAYLAWELSMPAGERVSVFLGGLLRDLGMLYVDPRLLDEPADQHFDGETWIEVQTHVVLSARILDIAGVSTSVKNAVLCHHERVDSTGYPQALWGKDVPVSGQLVGFADIVSTMRIKRFFGSGRNMKDALTILQLNMDSFDAKIGQAFTAMLHRAKLRSTAFLPHDRDTMLKILKRRAGIIRTSMLQLKEVSEDRRAKNRSPKNHILRGSVDRTLSNVMRSGHGDQDFVWWLGLVAAGKEAADKHQLSEIDLQQEELLWQLRRVRQELFKAVPSLNFKSQAYAI
ncbi:MAG: HD domain-containing phosphohydrolase [Myxococcota bacterium]